MVEYASSSEPAIARSLMRQPPADRTSARQEFSRRRGPRIIACEGAYPAVRSANYDLFDPGNNRRIVGGIEDFDWIAFSLLFTDPCAGKSAHEIRLFGDALGVAAIHREIEHRCAGKCPAQLHLSVGRPPVQRLPGEIAKQRYPRATDSIMQALTTSARRCGAKSCASSMRTASKRSPSSSMARAPSSK